MIASQSEIRDRIEQLRLSETGYRRQLDALDISPERRERLEVEVRLIGEEITTLELIGRMIRLEPDEAKIEHAVRERLDSLREQMAADPPLAELSTEERDSTSGEVRGLVWALGEDTLTRNMKLLTEGRAGSDPSRTDRVLSGVLIRNLEEAPSADTRASAAYELGKLQITQAVPSLVAALDDDQLVAELALGALAAFSDQQLEEAAVAEEIQTRIRAAQQP